MALTFPGYPTSSVSQLLLAKRVAYAVLAAVTSLLVAHWLWSYMAGKYIFLPMLAAVVLSVRRWGVIPSVAGALTALVGAWYCIVPPQYSFAVRDRADIVGLALFACISGLTIVAVRAEVDAHAADFNAEAIKTARLAMQGLLSGYYQTVCKCEGGGHDLSCMAHPSSPIIVRAERSIRWMYRVEESAEAEEREPVA
jgi:K+-sensing histidine kinase KdpD